MTEVPIKYFHLLVGFVGVVLQSWASLMILAHAFANVHADEKSPQPGWPAVLFICGSFLMIYGLSFFARAKGRTWLWGLFTLGFCPGWLLGAFILMLSRDKARQI